MNTNEFSLLNYCITFSTYSAHFMENSIFSIASTLHIGSTTRLQVTEHEGAPHTCSATPSCPDTADLLQLSATVEVSQLMGGCYSELPNYKSSVCCSQTVLHSRFISEFITVQVRFLLCLLLHCSLGYGVLHIEGSPILQLQA